MEVGNRKGKKALLAVILLLCLTGSGGYIYGGCKTSVAAAQEGSTPRTAVRLRQGKTAEGETGTPGAGRDTCYYKIRLEEDAGLSLHFKTDMKKGKLHVKIVAKDKRVRLKGGSFVLSRGMPETTLASGMMYAGVYYIKIRPGKMAEGKYTISYQE